ncbi:DUF5615 family PIN-like protein [Paenibacillus sp. NEAU-GSW1]|uniref:DUF5615 family PIN-like protein n=1 Tax=Paenibacillus sp. NEAU-GSW1 TaxID=2682486 RepID=UPI0012E269AA|nr:DUF5615 family PIN-like protein [Paenibacillus sp. NEAU-GSW1]MUT64917.1 hypothetical protein [Paenibacillus sp. NEAU-GSW1]
MRLFLDENITLRAAELFEQDGHDVISVQSLGLKGITDERVFEIARNQNRVLITHNGKHFIIQIPPRIEGVTHGGLLWLKFQLNRMNAEQVCGDLNNFFRTVTSVANSIWVYNKQSAIIRYYP